MGSKMVIKWPKQISASFVEQLIRAERDIQKATLIFDAATAECTNGFQHDHRTFGLMILKLLSANKFKSAEDLLNRMKQEKCKITEEILLSVCRAYGRVHKPLEVIRIFEKIKEYDCEPTKKLYVTVFSVLVNENQLKMALRFYKYMRKIGIPPCVTSLNVLIKALCKSSGTIDAALHLFRDMPNHGHIPDSYTYGTLINGLCRLGKTSEAKELFLEMDRAGCSPTVITYSSLIHGLCQSNDLDEGLRLFEEMKTKCIEPNVFTYSSLMDGLCKGGRCSDALDLFQMMVQSRHAPNMITYSTLIHGLCKDGRIQEALEVFDRMKLQGVKPDVGLYSKIIGGFCDTKKSQQASNFLDEMVLSGISPNRVTWSLHVKIHNIVVRGLCAENEQSRGFQLYLSMRARGISVEDETFDSLILCFCEQGDLHKAARIVDEMVLDGCIPDKRTWNALVAGFWSRKKMQKASESLEVELMKAIADSGTQSE